METTEQIECIDLDGTEVCFYIDPAPITPTEHVAVIPVQPLTELPNTGTAPTGGILAVVILIAVGITLLVRA